jgi:hypothetical protein
MPHIVRRSWVEDEDDRRRGQSCKLERNLCCLLPFMSRSISSRHAGASSIQAQQSMNIPGQDALSVVLCTGRYAFLFLALSLAIFRLSSTSYSYDNSIRFWEAWSGICCKTIQHPESVSFSERERERMQLLCWLCQLVDSKANGTSK